MLTAGDDLKAHILSGRFVGLGSFLGSGDIHKDIPVSV